ncbi:DUF7504 family protein [Halobacterium zhouii]|uniref:DUF7504 family protein n=1 Tax=Halobacterium zhouii TaxID=2902624 RepID=UPI001E294FB0|nr:hypothetical protein [Halobacterium zhouii]
MPNEGLSFRGDSPQSFEDVLVALKQNGCNLLVTGAVADDVTARATRKLLGTPTEPRERVLALTDSAVENPVTYLPGSIYPHHDGIDVLDYRDVGRSANTAERSDGGTPRTLDAISEDLCSTVARRGRDTAPAQLRLGVVSLHSLLDRHDDDAVEQFLGRVTESVLDASGMAHYHLRLPDDDPAVEALSPLFDARIELRQLDGMIPEQHWHVPESSVDTGWVTL